MQRFLMMTLVIFGLMGCAEEVPQPAASDVRSDVSIETVQAGTVLIDYDGEELPTIKFLHEVSWTEEVRKGTAFTARINRKDFEDVRKRICEFEPHVKEKSGDIFIHDVLEKEKSPYIRVDLPNKVKKVE